MDRISALRNIEEALADYEAGETDLAGLERRVRAVVRTYATEFEREGEGAAGNDLAAYRAAGAPQAEDVVVVAASPEEARRRIRDLLDADGLEFEVEHVG